MQKNLKLFDAEYRFACIVWKNDNAIITSLVKKEEVRQYESNAIIERAFNGSLPKFMTAFLKDKRLSHEEVNRIKDLIDRYKEG